MSAVWDYLRRNLGVDELQEQVRTLSKSSEALARLAEAALAVVPLLREARAEVGVLKAEVQRLRDTDAAEDAAQADAQDTDTAGKIDVVISDLVSALADPEVPVEVPADPVEGEPVPEADAPVDGEPVA